MTATKTADATTGLEHKAAVSPTEGLLDANDETGVVSALVSVTGVRDEDQDIIHPGAYKDTLARRKPKGIFGHDWGRWVARTEHVAELMPGDPRLPTKTRDGSRWPSEAGGVLVKMRFNLNTTEGRDAYENVKFFADDTEWSIGYKVPKGKATRDREGTRHIKALDWFEYSPVLFGSAPLSSTLAVKARKFGDRPDDQDAAPDDEPDMTAAAVDTAADTADGDDEAEDDEETRLHQAAEPDIDWDAVESAARYVPDDLLPDDVTDETDEDGPQQEALPDDGWGELLEGARKDYGDYDADYETKRQFSAERRRELANRDAAMPDGSFPIENAGDLQNAIRAIGRTPQNRRPKVKAHIRKRARALGLTDRLPDDWDTGKGLDPLVEEKAGTPGVADTPSDLRSVQQLQRWYEHGGGATRIAWGTPDDFYRCVSIAGKHMTGERAKGFCALRHRGALGVWPGQERGGKGRKELAGEFGLRDGQIRVEPVTDPQPDLESKTMCLPGSYEERAEALRDELTKALTGDGWDYVALDGTWDDKVVATRHKWSPHHDVESFEIPYEWGENGPVLGQPKPVRLVATVQAAPEGRPLSVADLLPLADMVAEAAGATKRLLSTKAQIEGANEARLASAVEDLVTVLRGAGVELNLPDEPAEEDTEETDGQSAEAPTPQWSTVSDTTAPSARDDGMKQLAPADYARGLRTLADA